MVHKLLLKPDSWNAYQSWRDYSSCGFSISHLGLSIEQGLGGEGKVTCPQGSAFSWNDILPGTVLVVKSLRVKSFPKWSAGISALSILGLWKGPLAVTLGNVDFGSDLPLKADHFFWRSAWPTFQQRPGQSEKVLQPESGRLPFHPNRWRPLWLCTYDTTPLTLLSYGFPLA